MDWFAFSFVMMTLYVYLTFAIILRYSFIMKQTDLIVVSILGLIRVVQIVFLKIRNADRTIVEYSNTPWIGYTLVYVATLALLFVVESKFPLLYCIAIIDFSLFLGQTFYYYSLKSTHGAPAEVEDDNFQTDDGMRKQSLTQRLVSLSEGIEEMEDMDQFKYRETKINNDIYSLAFAAFLDPAKLETENDKYLHQIKMNTEEVADLFMGSMMVTFVQCVTIYMILQEELKEEF